MPSWLADLIAIVKALLGVGKPDMYQQGVDAGRTQVQLANDEAVIEKVRKRNDLEDRLAGSSPDDDADWLLRNRPGNGSSGGKPDA